MPVHGELDWKVLSPENPIEYSAALDFLALGNGRGQYAVRAFKKSVKKSFETAGEKALNESVGSDGNGFAK